MPTNILETLTSKIKTWCNNNFMTTAEAQAYAYEYWQSHAPHSMELEFLVTANQTLTLWGKSGLTYNGTIDWGDGSAEEAFTTYNPSHTYASAGTYTVKIFGSFPGWFNTNTSNASCLSLRKIKSWGGKKFSSLNLGFYYCTGLTEIAADTYGALSDVTSFDSCFYYCSSLTAIPAGLFDNCTNVTTFYSCFGNCRSLTAIPAGLFDYCPNVTDFSYCFRNCYLLTAIPAGLFDYCTKVSNFYGCFRNCYLLTAIPAGLFDYCPNVTNFGYCFVDCYDLVLRGDEYTLSTLIGRTINFGNCFQAQSTSTSSTYQKVGTAPELWNAGLASGSTTTHCFTNRTLLTNYADIPSGWK